jgi:sulfatase maturation enzyme AslB (radical SAM superfamily)
MSNTPLCYAPFIGMYADYTGNYAPCCVAEKVSSAARDFWTGEQVVGMRKKMLANEWPDECSYCKNRESNGLTSDIELWKIAYANVNKPLDLIHGTDNMGPYYLDMRPGNECNLKCRMCGPQFSSQWVTEINNNPKIGLNWLMYENKNSQDFLDFINYSDNQNLLEIKILGGEPTIDEKVILFLENMITTQKKLPRLRFTTNATNLNKRFQKIMSSFDSIHIVFSVDATGREFDYIRTNANWTKVKNNIEKIFEKDLASHCDFNSVLMPYNIFSIIPLLEWYKSLFDRGYRFSVLFSDSAVGYTSLSAVLEHDLLHAVAGVEQYLSTVNDDFRMVVSEILPLLKSVQSDHHNHSQFKEYNNLLDNVRQTSLLSLNERFSDYV